ncbi:hypothetical protein [Paenibacillus macerans]|uniref:Uncharacterized protein n=1 Tax=Paenibacillus macerans TaxID=44252 RepID=A0A090Y8D6_PAEMA|nr:hypothetical protein [Paenibacillus macerans]KFM94466.1 hypothetical protein DJ90_1349 [Paenibacillus macerans]MCY7557245.1 hypothetical protein [Paenibacillus macerans]MEC0151777.1 hypothetical protein [Paenibacillus macerans]MED4953449.1 hypothetical protein [Paenibacillus macerans]SUD25397.1 Uncharacterised protein [Paenibacillus macerans]
MKYLNISIEPLDDTNTVYFYGGALPIDFNLLNITLYGCPESEFLQASEAMQQLVNRTLERTHINLFVKQVNFPTYGAIHGFLKFSPKNRRLMVWVFDKKLRDCRALGFYEL